MDAAEASATALLLVAASATVGQLLLLPTLPLVDWPNHLARLHALAAEPGSAIRHSYVPHWALIPDLGCDLIDAALKAVLSPEAVLRLCLCGSLLVISAAVWRIQRVLFRRTTYAASIAPLMIAGLPVGMGYVNYLLSISVALASVALYVSWAPRLTAGRLSCLSILATMSWLAHLAGYGVLALVLGATLLCHRPDREPARRMSTAVLRAAGIYLAVIGPGLLLCLLAEQPVSSATISYGEGVQKLRFLLAPWLATASASSVAIVALWVGIVALVGRFGSLRLSSVLRPALWLLGALIVLLPWQLGDAIDVDARLVLPFTALGLASTRVVLPRSVVLHAACVASVILMLVLRWQALERSGQDVDREVTAFRKVAALLPEGSAIMTARDVDQTGACRRSKDLSVPLLHLAAYATVDRGAYVPTIFTAAGMQPLRAAKPPFDAGARPIAPPSFALLTAITEAGGVASLSPSRLSDPALRRELDSLIRSKNTAFLDHWPSSYDALLVLHRGCQRNLMPSRLSVLANDDSFTMYRVHGRDGGDDGTGGLGRRR